MPISRKDFIKIGGLTFAGLFVPTRKPFLAGWFNQEKGLWFDKEELPNLKSKFLTDPAFESLRKTVHSYDYAAKTKFLRNDVQYNDQLYDIMTVIHTIEEGSFNFAMTGAKKGRDLAVEAIETLMKFPKWDYFLEAGKYVIGLQRASAATHAICLSLAWLDGEITPDQKRTWLKEMGTKGVEPCFRSVYGMRYPDRVVGWTIDPESAYLIFRPGDTTQDLSRWPIILNSTNLKAVPANDLLIGAIAYEKEFGKSKDTERWIEQGLYTFKTLGKLYKPDGSYPEGVSYSGYTSAQVMQSTDVIKRVLEKDYFDLVDWKGYARYLLEMSMPTHEQMTTVVNFGDTSLNTPASIPYWIARKTKDSTTQWIGENLSRDADPLALIWYNENLKGIPPTQKNTLWKCDLDWIVARTGYQVDDLVVAMRSGGPSNHEHADRNSIIVKCYGEQLVADPMHAPYNFKDPAWMMRTTAGHNSILIDGHGHQYHDGHEGTNSSKARATITEWKQLDDYMYWTSDATPAYQMVLPDVKSITRSVIVFPKTRAVILIDKVIKSKKPSSIQARFFGFNDDGKGKIEASNKGFKSVRPHAYMIGMAKSVEDLSYQSKKLPIPEETAVKHPFAEISSKEKSLEPFMVTVLLPVANGSVAPTATITPNGTDRFTANIKEAGQVISCEITNKGPVPSFHVTVKS